MGRIVLWTCLAAGAVIWWYFSTVRTLQAVRSMLVEERKAKKKQNAKRRKNHSIALLDKRKVRFALPPIVLPPAPSVPSPVTVGSDDSSDDGESPPPSESENSTDDEAAGGDPLAAVRKGDVPMFTPREALID